jgi:uncharacterized protein (DUF983 family)
MNAACPESGEPRLDIEPRARRSEVLARVVRLRCPHCGVGRLYEGLFRMRPACAVCGFHFEREPGFFVGAIYLNYAVTVLIGLGGVLLLDTLRPMPLRQQLLVALPLMVLVPLCFFRYARSAWLGLNYVVSRPGREDFR